MPDLHFSATDLTAFLGCAHLALLNRRTKEGGPKPPKYDDPALEVLWARGLEHEAAYEESLRAAGLTILRIPEPPRGDGYWVAFTAATAQAMRDGVQVIVQGGLRHGPWVGRPDFLLRVDRPGGEWTYEVIDTKLAREAKGSALLQVLLYAELVGHVHGAGPEYVHIALGGPHARRESFRVAEYAAYFRTVRDRFLALQAGYSAGMIPTAPEPVEQCGICAWRGQCSEERHAADHLSLVAGIARAHREALRRAGVHTLAQLAALDPAAPVEGISRSSLLRIREQARIQLAGREARAPRHELLPPEADQGLAALPAPSPGDIFLDLEANPYAFTHGIEYLFGVAEVSGSYHASWALDRAQEKQAFERFIDYVMERLEQYPDLHIYHFAPYEVTALKRLMGFHATREAEVDRLLRGRVFVDLYRVTRQALRASVESYSIKKLEPFYGYTRDVDLRDASTALARFDAWLEMDLFQEQRAEMMAAVEAYNRDDCLSTLKLRDWLESLRSPDTPRPSGPEAEEEEREPSEQQAEVARRVAALTADVPADPDARSEEQQARWLLAQLLEFHRREKKAFWWEYFARREFTEDELLEDRSTLGGLEFVEVVGQVKQSLIHRYRFPVQEHGIKLDKQPHDPVTGSSAGKVTRLDDALGIIELSRGVRSQAPHPAGLIPYDLVREDELRDSILRIADRVITDGLCADLPHAAAQLLLRRPPRLSEAGPLQRPGEELVDAACRLATTLDRTVLPIQGPPGAGKTYTAAKMIVRALEAGLRVGITASGHKVIGNLLAGVCGEARARGLRFTAIQKAEAEQGCEDALVTLTGDNAAVAEALAHGEASLAAGTAWLWSREEMAGSVDLLFIDEAGQFSLANALAVTPAAKSVVMLGDPRQLEQPQQGVHPPGADLSALEHLLQEHATIPAERGLFLEHTWRLHPEICDFTSEIFYEGRLRARPGLERQEMSSAPLRGSGLRYLAVPHAGNSSEALEEVDAIEALVDALTSGATWVDAEGVEKPLGRDDILVVAPYNAQVSALEQRLGQGARVGTVDRFQGQEAPVVIYSMTTSTPADAPRGMEFLYSPNRLNVATSRARCVAIVVASPELFLPACTTPRQMKLANPFCRYRELAGPLGAAG